MLYHYLHGARSPATRRSRGSTPTSSPRSARRCASATRDEQILAELRAHAGRSGRSPTMKEFAADPEAAVHPQTVIEHFGSWNAAKRAAGLVPRRFATREELLALLRALGEELGRTPTDPRPRRAPRRRCRRSRSTGTPSARSPRRCARPASTSPPVRSGSSARSSQGVGARPRARPAAEVRRLVGARRRARPAMLTEWQVYRMFDSRRGAWATFQFLIRQRMLEEGGEVGRRRLAAVGLEPARSAGGGDRGQPASGRTRAPAARAPPAAGRARRRRACGSARGDAIRPRSSATSVPSRSSRLRSRGTQ